MKKNANNIRCLAGFALLSCCINAAAQTTIIYQNDFEAPNSFVTPNYWADANSPTSFTTVYPSSGAVIQNYQSPDVIRIGTGVYTDPSGVGGTYSIGMVNPDRELMSFSFDASSAGNFVNFGLDLSKAGLRRITTGATHYYSSSSSALPDLNFSVYDTPNGVFNINTLYANSNAYTLINSGTFTGSHSAYNVMDWTHVIGSFNIASATDGNVTLVLEKPSASATSNRYTVFDNLSIVVSRNAPSQPTISKAFNPATVSPGGVSTLTITITGNNASLLSGVSVTDNLPTPLLLTGNNSTTCTGGTLTGTANTSTLSLSNAALPANGCTITAEVTWPSGQGCTIQPVTNAILGADFQISSLNGFNSKPATTNLACQSTPPPSTPLSVPSLGVLGLLLTSVLLAIFGRRRLKY